MSNSGATTLLSTPPTLPPLTSLPAAAIESLPSSGGVARPPLSPLSAVLSAVCDDLLADIALDACAAVHKEAHTRTWNSVPSADVDVFGLPNVKKVPEKSFKCESCGQKTGSSKYAAHLERCTGKGGRSSRRAKATHSATGSAMGAAAASATPALPALATRDDDVEVIAAARGGGGGGGSMAPKPRPASAGLGLGLARGDADSSMGIGVGYGHGHGHGHARSATPLTAMHAGPGPAPSAHMGSGGGGGGGVYRMGTSPFASANSHMDGLSSSPSTYGTVHPGSSSSALPSPYSAATGGESSAGSPVSALSSAAGGPDQWPDGSAGGAELDLQDTTAGLAGHKRRMEDGATTKLPSEKKRRNARVDEYWTAPLPAELPTQLSLGGLPYVVDASEAGLGTAPSPAQLVAMLSRICGVPSAATNKMCSNKPACSMHPEEDRLRLRAAVEHGSAIVRFKKVKATAVKKKGNAANAGLNAQTAGMISGY